MSSNEAGVAAQADRKTQRNSKASRSEMLLGPQGPFAQALPP